MNTPPLLSETLDFLLDCHEREYDLAQAAHRRGDMRGWQRHADACAGIYHRFLNETEGRYGPHDP